MKIIADTHCHTIASTHAYSTLLENVEYANSIGLKFLAITDHGPQMPDAPHIWHFYNLKAFPNKIKDVYVLKGIEANILNINGEIDVDQELLEKLQWVIASIHEPVVNFKNESEVTQAYINLSKNPYVDVIGHCGNPNFKFDYDKTIKIFKEHEKIVEINQGSILSRIGSVENCKEIAKLCKKYEVKIVVNSDSHFAHTIGKFDDAISMLKDIDFPEKLILNADYNRFCEYLKVKKNIVF